MIFYGTRWIGNGVLPILSVVALIYLLLRGSISRRFLPGVIGVFVYATLVAAVATYTFAFWERPRNEWVVFSPLDVVLWFGGIPVQELCNLLLGEDNFVEEHLLIIAGMVTWGIAGLLVAAVIRVWRRERKAAQPGATDNPDDAQRLREDQ